MSHSNVRTALATSIFALALSSATTARAEPTTEGPSESRWYGAPILAMDVSAVVVGGVGLGTFYALLSSTHEHQIEPLALMTAPAILTYLFGGPIVHWAHGHGARGFASLALHLVPIVGSVVDIALLSRERVEPPPKLRWTPIASVDGHGVTTGFALEF